MRTLEELFEETAAQNCSILTGFASSDPWTESDPDSMVFIGDDQSPWWAD